MICIDRDSREEVVELVDLADLAGRRHQVFRADGEENAAGVPSAGRVYLVTRSRLRHNAVWIVIRQRLDENEDDPAARCRSINTVLDAALYVGKDIVTVDSNVSG